MKRTQMTNMALTLLVWTVICGMATGLLAQESEKPKDITISVLQPLQSINLSTGFYPAIVQLKNHSENEHHLHVQAIVIRDDVQLLSTNLTLAPGEQTQVELPIQVNVTGGIRIEVESEEAGELSKTFLSLSSYTGSLKGIPILFLMQPEEEQAIRLNSGLSRVIQQGNSIAPHHSPTMWVSLTGLECVCITFDGLRTLDAIRRRAILRYVEAGGHLTVCSAMDEEAAIIVDLLDLDAAVSDKDGRLTHIYGMGRVTLDRASPETLLPPDQPSLARVIADIRGSSIHHAMRRFSITPQRLELPGVDTVPARSFIIIVALFAILIGPVNFYILTRKRKRTLALMTIPALSLLATISLATYSFAYEGISAKIVPQTLTHLDQRRHRFGEIAKVGVFSGLMTSGMQFSGVVAPLPTGREQVSGWRSRPLPVNWEDGTHLAQTWLPSRTTTEFIIARSGPCRKRLLIERQSDGEITVGNALGVPVESLFFCAGEKKFFTGAIGIDGTATAREYLRSEVHWEDLIEGVSDTLLENTAQIFSLLSMSLQSGSYIGRTGTPLINEWGLDDPEVLPGINILNGRFDLEEK